MVAMVAFLKTFLLNSIYLSEKFKKKIYKFKIEW